MAHSNGTKSKRRGQRKFLIQKAAGIISHRVRDVGAEHFAIVCVDPAKNRSRWMMADFFGNVLIEPATAEHTAGHLAVAVDHVRRTIAETGMRDVLVIVERTGNYHRPFQQAFAKAGFETRVLHPFATKQYRQIANPGDKTDDTDLAAQHRAAVAGFGLVELPLDEHHRRQRLLARHRRDLVEKASTLCCQIREHLHLCMPGYVRCFDDIWGSTVALPIVHQTGSPHAVLECGTERLGQLLRTDGLRFQQPTLDKILAWARQAPPPDEDAPLHHRMALALDEDRSRKRREIEALERDLATSLVRTPYVLLLAFPGINVVSAAEFAGEMGPIAHYANSNAMTGRAGLYPARYQSDEVDAANGPLVRCANRRLRAAILRIADNLVQNNRHFRGRAELLRSQGVDERAIRVQAAKKFTRLAYAMVAGRQVLRHPACQPGDALLTKLIAFHRAHDSAATQMMADLHAAVDQLPKTAYPHEADSLSKKLVATGGRCRGPMSLGDILPAVLARLTEKKTTQTSEVQVPS